MRAASGARLVVDLGDDVLECELDVGGVEGGGFDEGEAVLL